VVARRPTRGGQKLQTYIHQKLWTSRYHQSLFQKIEFLPKMEEFAKPASKKYRKNTICILKRKYSKF
jgi:hypothetical protein